MSDKAVKVQGVWKKFRKGQMHDSLREAIPAMAQRLLGRKPSDELGNNQFWALRDVSFEIPRGQSLGIIGPNGAGKSTMFKVLSRILRPNRGSYKIQGRLASMIEVGAGFHGDLTGRENIYLNGAILGMNRREIQAKEEAIIDFAGVEEFIETPIKRYSSGMTARLGFAVAAHLDPDVLLVDEVLSVGDAKFRAKCIAHMNNLLSSGITVMFVSHLLDQIRTLCPRTLVLVKGQVAFEGATDAAVKVYLDALESDIVQREAASGTPAYVREITFRDEAGNELLAADSLKPLRVDFDIVVTRPVKKLAICGRFQTVGGAHLTTVSNQYSDTLRDYQPGEYRITLQLPHLPLGEGDFWLQAGLFEAENPQQVWFMLRPRTLSVKSALGIITPMAMAGDWSEDKTLIRMSDDKTSPQSLAFPKQDQLHNQLQNKLHNESLAG